MKKGKKEDEEEGRKTLEGKKENSCRGFEGQKRCGE
jgi:hypothetical protein